MNCLFSSSLPVCRVCLPHLQGARRRRPRACLPFPETADRWVWEDFSKAADTTLAPSHPTRNPERGGAIGSSVQGGRHAARQGGPVASKMRRAVATQGGNPLARGVDWSAEWSARGAR
jgi:hypothetical protein